MPKTKSRKPALTDHPDWADILAPYYKDETDPTKISSGSHQRVDVACPVCGTAHPVPARSAILGKIRCRSCAARETKRTYTKRPPITELPIWETELSPYYRDETDPSTITAGMPRKITVECPECHQLKEVAVRNWVGGQRLCGSCSSSGGKKLDEAECWSSNAKWYHDERDPHTIPYHSTAIEIVVECPECHQLRTITPFQFSQDKLRHMVCKRPAKTSDTFLDEHPRWKEIQPLYRDEADPHTIGTGSAKSVQIECPKCHETHPVRASHLFDQKELLCYGCSIASPRGNGRYLTEIDEWEKLKPYYKDEKDPSTLSASSSQRILIACPECGELRTKSVQEFTQSHGLCLKCAKAKSESQIEQKIRLAIESLEIEQYGFRLEPQWTYPMYTGGVPYAADFGILDSSNNLVATIEGNGDQHYRPVSFFGGEKNFGRQCRNDKIKRDWCHEHGIPMLEISHLFSDGEIRHSVIGFLATCDIIPSAAYFDLYAPRPSGSVPPSCAHDSYEIVGRVSCDEDGKVIMYGIGRQALKGEEFDALKSSPKRAVEEVLRNAGRELGEGECLFEVVLTHVRTPSATAEYDCWHDLAPLETIVIPVSPPRLPV